MSVVELAERATSVPFTAVTTGPERDNHGQHQGALDLRRSLPSQVTIALDLALGAGSRICYRLSAAQLRCPYKATSMWSAVSRLSTSPCTAVLRPLA